MNRIVAFGGFFDRALVEDFIWVASLEKKEGLQFGSNRVRLLCVEAVVGVVHFNDRILVSSGETNRVSASFVGCDQGSGAVATGIRHGVTQLPPLS